MEKFGYLTCVEGDNKSGPTVVVSPHTSQDREGG